MKAKLKDGAVAGQDLTGGYLVKLDKDANLPASAVTATTAPQLFTQTTAYPNPFDNSLTVELRLPRPAALQLELLDLTGRRVAAYPTRPLPAGVSKQTLPSLENTRNGLYLLRISSAGATRTIRVMRQGN